MASNTEGIVPKDLCRHALTLLTMGIDLGEVVKDEEVTFRSSHRHALSLQAHVIVLRVSGDRFPLR